MPDAPNQRSARMPPCSHPAILLGKYPKAEHTPVVLPDFQSVLDGTVAALKEALGENLCSCCVYGSAVRGNLIEGVSDINLLIVLRKSTVAAHESIAKILAGQPKVDPFILARRGFERSLRAFATKFQSIRRNYRLLHGEDLLAGVKTDPQLERFLCEQAIRNLRLRLVYAFVTRAQNQAYDRFLVRNTTTMFVQFSEALRLNDVVVPKDFPARITVMAKEFGTDATILNDLLALKAKPRRLNDGEALAWHTRLFPLVDQALVWVETHWPG